MIREGYGNAEKCKLRGNDSQSIFVKKMLKLIESSPYFHIISENQGAPRSVVEGTYDGF